DNDVRSERTRGGMKAALELGRWTFLAPLGYLNAARSTGKSLIPDPERASLVRRAFQEFATGQFTKDEVRKNVVALGLTTRRGKPVPSQTFDAMLRNRVYVGQVDVPDFNVSKRGDFEPLITERIFFRVQAILDGRYEATGPRQRNDPDFPLRGYVRCETCGKPLTASWSKGRSDYYAYYHYHCRGRCRAVNVSKTKLEELFVERANASTAFGWFHASCERAGSERMARDARRCEAAHRRDRTEAERDSREAGPFGSRVPVRPDDRHRYVRPSPRQAARGTDAHADGPSHRGARGTRRRGHPGVRRARS